MRLKESERLCPSILFYNLNRYGSIHNKQKKIETNINTICVSLRDIDGNKF